MTRSCSSAEMISGFAPRPATNRDSRSTASLFVLSSGVKIHGRPANRSGRANAKPPRWPPPSGCPPTKVTPGASARAAFTISRLVPPTSVMVMGWPICWRSSMFWRTGAARTISETSGNAPIVSTPRSMAPAPSACASTGSESTPNTRDSGQRSRTAKAMEPPIRPRPTMAMDGNGTSDEVMSSGFGICDFLTSPAAASHGLETDAAANRRRDDPQLRHQPFELRREHRLRAIAQRAIRVVVDLDDEAIASRRDRRARQLRHHVPPTGAVARVGDDRQVTQLLHDRNRGDVERVARRGLERADAALAQDHVVVAAREDVLGREQPFLDGRGDAALEQHRLAGVTELPQQRVVLHVARAHLEDVAVLRDQLDLADVHHLGDDLEVVRIGRAAQHAQPLLAETLEGVRRAARLERAAAQDLRPRPLDGRGNGVHLLIRLRRAGAGHDDHLVAPYSHVVDVDKGVLGLEGAARALVRLRDAEHLVDAVEDADQLGVDLVGADDAQHGSRHPRRTVNVHPQLDEARDHGIDLRLGGALVHYDDHVITLQSKDRSLQGWNPTRVRHGALRR